MALLSLTLVTSIASPRLLKVKAAESTAAMKGFEVENLVYLDDQNLDIKTLATSNYTYGTYSAWNACYKYVVNESNGTDTCYYFVLLEASINSSGKHDKYRFFRNKELSIELYFNATCGDKAYLATYTPQGSSSTTSMTVGVNLGGEIGLTESGAGMNASVSYSKTTEYDTVTLTLSREESNLYKNLKFCYEFLNWKDGAMISPNIGLVQKRMIAVFGVENYIGVDDFKLQIKTTATIFKDATWPRSNYTYVDSTNHYYINGFASEAFQWE